MSANRKTPVDAFRSRQKRAGIVRVEVQVAKEDAALVRGVAKALGDPVRQGEIRRLLNSRLTTWQPNFKDFLLSAPLDDVDLTRSRHAGRDVDL
jgi:hypothetical protein